MTKLRVFEHDFEPVEGLPADLPEGERILWQGRPQARAIARRLMKTHWIALYFLGIAVFAFVSGLQDGRDLGSILISTAALGIFGAIVIGLVELYAWGVAKTSLYTITERRLVLRVGVALSVSVNLPFAVVASADMKAGGDGVGDIALHLARGSEVSWFMLWPHVLTFKRGKAAPLLRCLPEVTAVAEILGVALRRNAEQPAAVEPRPTLPSRPVRMPAELRPVTS